jgi:hypothetical protein
VIKMAAALRAMSRKVAGTVGNLHTSKEGVSITYKWPPKSLTNALLQQTQPARLVLV